MWTLTALSIVFLMASVYSEKLSVALNTPAIRGDLSPRTRYFRKPWQVSAVDDLNRFVSIPTVYLPTPKRLLAPCVGECSFLHSNYGAHDDKRNELGVGVGTVYQFREGSEAVIPSKSKHEKEDDEEHHSTHRSSDQHIAGVKCARTDQGDCRRTVVEELPVQAASIFLLPEDKKRAVENKEEPKHMSASVDSVSGIKCGRDDKGDCMKEVKEESDSPTRIRLEYEDTNVVKYDSIKPKTNKNILTVGKENTSQFGCNDINNSLSEPGCDNKKQSKTKPNIKDTLYGYSVSVETDLKPQELPDIFKNNLDDKQEITNTYTPVIDQDQSESDLNPDMCQNSATGEPILDHECQQNNINGKEKVASKNQDPLDTELQHEMQYNELFDQQYDDFVPYSYIMKRSSRYSERQKALSAGGNAPARANNLSRIKSYYSPRGRYSRLKRMWEVGYPFEKKLRARAVLDVLDYNPKTQRTTKLFFKTDPLVSNDESGDQLINSPLAVPNNDLYSEHKINQGSSSDLSVWKSSKLRLKREAASHRTDLSRIYQKQGTEVVKIGINGEVQETKMLVGDKSQQLEDSLENENSATTSVGEIVNSMDNQRLLSLDDWKSRSNKRSITEADGTNYSDSDDELSELCKNYRSQNCDNDTTKHAIIKGSLSKTDDLRKNMRDKNTTKHLDRNVLCSQNTMKKCYYYFQHINKTVQTNNKSNPQKMSTRTTSISRAEDMKLRQNSQARRLARHSSLVSDSEEDYEHPRWSRSPKLHAPTFRRLNLPPIRKANEISPQFEMPKKNNIRGNENIQTLRKYSDTGEKIHSPITLLFTGVAKFVNERLISHNNSFGNTPLPDSVREVTQEEFKREDEGFSTINSENIMTTSDSSVREGRRAALGRIERTRNPKENNFLACDTSSDSLVREGRRAAPGRIDRVNNPDGKIATHVYFSQKPKCCSGENLNNVRQVTKYDESYSDLYGTDGEQEFSPPSYFEPSIRTDSTDLLLDTEDQKVSDLDINGFNNQASYLEDTLY